MRLRLPMLGLAAAASLLALGLMSAPALAAPGAEAVTTPHITTAIHAPTVRKDCATPTKAHTMACFALLRTDIGALYGSVSSNALTPNVTPSGLGPANLASAYKLSTSGGAGQTVAVVDAYNNPTAAADLAVYRSQYGLPACTVASGCLKIVNQNGATSPLPTTDTGWAGEESLDLDMVSAICPNCHIILVEASSATDSNLYAAEDRAVSLGAKFVSNSWGGTEYSGQTTDDAYFNHPGVVVTASTGDAGYGASFPATSQYVTAVGGTTLNTSTNTRGWSETAWAGAGSGCSAYEPKPSWQTVTTGCARRAEGDVSAVADPATGVAVYQTTGAAGWVVYGGTSASSPVIASVYALAGTPAAGTYPASLPYAHAANLFDVISGKNGTCSTAVLCTAATGWDGPTGLGTPNGTAAFSATAPVLAVSSVATQTNQVGATVALGMAAGGGTAPYTWTASGLPAGLTIAAATGVISGKPTTIQTSTVTVTAHDAAAHTASTSFSWVINAVAGCTAAQLLGNPGFESGNTIWSAAAAVIGVNGPSEPAHSGTYDAWLDGYGTTHTDTLSQSVTIATNCKGVLNFYLHVDTAETSTTTQFDKLTVQATVGTVTSTLATYSNLNHNAGYVLVSLPITGAGTTKITFTGVEDSTLQTSFVLDDLALIVS